MPSAIWNIILSAREISVATPGKPMSGAELVQPNTAQSWAASATRTFSCCQRSQFPFQFQLLWKNIFQLYFLPLSHTHPSPLTHCFRLSSLIWCGTSAPLFWHQIGVFIKTVVEQRWHYLDMITRYLQISTDIFLTTLLTFRYCHPHQFDIAIGMSPPQWPLQWHYHQISSTINWNIKGKEKRK